MDETDTKILHQILSDGRSSYRKIAEQIGVSPPTVLNRIQKLESNHIIKSYSAVLDHEKLGFDLTAIIEVTAVKGKITEVEKHISKFRNRKELSDFVKKDLSLPFVERTNSHMVLVTVKEDFRFF